MPTCTSCGGSSIETDHARGSAVCTRCGMVLEDNIIMAEVSFMDTDKGGSGVVGQFVNADGAKMFPFWPSSFHHGFGRDSKAVTLQNGKNSIAKLASVLSLNNSHVDAAHNYFKLAVEHKFIQGRKTENVVAACLYIECRKQQTSHMLLDFSDSLQINVFILGAVYLKLCRKLKVKLPVVDPSLYIARFAHRLDFKDKTHEVSMTALRLVHRMKRDWIQVGRRPAGICGAALLIAARLHGFSCTQSQIIDVVRVCNATLRKRLEEFNDTPSSELTPQEFQEIDLEEEADPPAYQQARRRMKVRDATAEEVEQLEKLSETAAFRALDEDVIPVLSAVAPAPAGAAPAAAAAAPVQSQASAHWVVPAETTTLSDVDDEEIEEAIMPSEEVAAKEKVWNEMNKDYLEKQAAKEKQAASDKEMGIVKREPKKRKRRRDRAAAEPAANAEEALQQMLAQKKVSKKLNYNVLEGLNIPAEPQAEAAAVDVPLGGGAAAVAAVTQLGAAREEAAEAFVEAEPDAAEDDGYDYYDGGEEDFA